MIITACNERYLPHARLMLLSMVRHGGVPPRRLGVMVFGPAAARLRAKRALRAEVPGLRLWDVDPASPDFDFLRGGGSEGPWFDFLFADYLKAYASRFARRYVWIDSDILATGDLRALFWILDSCETLAMAQNGAIPPEVPADSPYRVEGAMYSDMLRWIFPRARPWLNVHGDPMTLNAGVIVLAQDYDPLFRRLYARVRGYFTTARWRQLVERLPYGNPGAGQGVWNVIGWTRASSELPGEFNRFGFQALGRGTLEHYLGDLRPNLERRALELGLGTSPRGWSTADHPGMVKRAS